MFPTPATFRGPSPLQRACADGLFFCNSVWRMPRGRGGCRAARPRRHARSLWRAPTRRCTRRVHRRSRRGPSPSSSAARGVRPSTELRTARGWRAPSTLCPPCSPPRPRQRLRRAAAAAAGRGAAGDSDGAGAAAVAVGVARRALRARADALLEGRRPRIRCRRRAFKLDGGCATLPAPLPRPVRATAAARAAAGGRRRPRAWGNSQARRGGGWVAGADLRVPPAVRCARCKYVATAPSRGECAWHALLLDALHVVGDGAEYFTVSEEEPKARRRLTADTLS